MNEKVRQFLIVKQAEEKQKRDEALIELGLFEKQYNPYDQYDSDYPYSEWDEQTGTTRFFKKVACPVTDQEYAYIKKYAGSSGTDTANSNPVANALSVIAWVIYIAGFIAGFYFGTIEIGSFYGRSQSEFSFAIAMVYWCGALISGTIFLGFAEIIKLLNAIKNKD